MNTIRLILKSPLLGLVSKYHFQFRPLLVNYAKCYSTTKRSRNTSSEDDEITNEPIKYSQSVASKWQAADSRKGHNNKDNRPEAERYVIIASVAVFMLYFCILREESDLDENLMTSLYSRVDGLEEVQLRNELRYKEEHGLETEDIIKRLEQIVKNK